MEITKEQALEDFGLSQKEVQVYLKLLRIGESTVSKLSKETGINRVTIYDILKYLSAKGLVSSTVKNNVKVFSPANPKTILQILEERKNKITAVLDALEKEKEATIETPKLQFYEGKDGIKALMWDIIKTKKPLLSFSTEYGISKFLKYYVPDFVKSRVKAGVQIKHITSSKERYKEWKEKDKEELRETRLFKDLKTSSQIYIYGNKVTILNINHEKPSGILIENTQFSKSLANIFDIIWTQAK